jgi:hypothetical protein
VIRELLSLALLGVALACAVLAVFQDLAWAAAAAAALAGGLLLRRG